jgi:hypothetical protein
MEGFVWREACGPADRVCVPPRARDQAREDNVAGPGRVQPGGGPSGPDTCRQGFVWREACDPNDHVCVIPVTRSQAADDNSVRGARLKYPHCQSYARDAVRAQGINQRYGCNFSGDRWSTFEEGHFRWCLNSPDRDVAREMAARYSKLDDCNALAGREARGVPPPTNTGAPGTTAPGNPPKCCFLPVADPSGNIGVGYTCGPVCP